MRSILLCMACARLCSYIAYDGQYEVDGGLISATPRELTIYYNCQKKVCLARLPTVSASLTPRQGEGKMHVTLKLPLYESIEFSWKKQCGRTSLSLFFSHIVCTATDVAEVKMEPAVDTSVWTANQALLLLYISLSLSLSPSQSRYLPIRWSHCGSALS